MSEQETNLRAEWNACLWNGESLLKQMFNTPWNWYLLEKYFYDLHETENSCESRFSNQSLCWKWIICISATNRNQSDDDDAVVGSGILSSTFVRGFQRNELFWCPCGRLRQFTKIPSKHCSIKAHSKSKLKIWLHRNFERRTSHLLALNSD